MTDPIDLGPLPRPFVPGDEHNPRDFYASDQLRAERQRTYALGREHERAAPATAQGEPVAWMVEGGWLYLRREEADWRSRKEGGLAVSPLYAAPPAAPAHGVVEALREALLVAVTQNEHDMLMTGDELRACRAALAAAQKGDR